MCDVKAARRRSTEDPPLRCTSFSRPTSEEVGSRSDRAFPVFPVRCESSNSQLLDNVQIGKITSSLGRSLLMLRPIRHTCSSFVEARSVYNNGIAVNVMSSSRVQISMTAWARNFRRASTLFWAACGPLSPGALPDSPALYLLRTLSPLCLGRTGLSAGHDGFDPTAVGCRCPEYTLPCQLPPWTLSLPRLPLQ